MIPELGERTFLVNVSQVEEDRWVRGRDRRRHPVRCLLVAAAVPDRRDDGIARAAPRAGEIVRPIGGRVDEIVDVAVRERDRCVDGGSGRRSELRSENTGCIEVLLRRPYERIVLWPGRIRDERRLDQDRLLPL